MAPGRLEPKPATTENFNIQVSFRLKPKSQEEDEEKEVTLPLHQRIQLIKMSKKVRGTVYTAQK